MASAQVLLVALLLSISIFYAEGGALQYGFYGTSCPSAEGLVNSAVTAAINDNKRTAAGLIRLLFHDCFVEGCDASILIDSTDGNTAEKDATPNLTIQGFDVIDSAKASIEAVCPGIVSCADIVALAARDSVRQLAGISYQVETGRRDGTVSLSSALSDFPSPLSDAQTLTQNFNAKGLSLEQMVVLSGAHSIGKAHCGAFSNRLYNFDSTSNTDPSLDSSYAANLKAMCPESNTNNETVTDLDLITPTTLDSQYYSNLINNRGLLTSDQTLYTSSSTQQQVILNANSYWWEDQFSDAMQAMGRIGVKTGSDGQIRQYCRVVKA
ncbi:peroxidase [Marchantia polymorpha subsp. ruderalis]|uniref:Peroxidase n=2 Tax=Marchantia polymorpha TaxID=3197 RepID=A0AAF6BZR1_MARPO|nr:hypothetical protein MARPO_0009s0185 [Marchantia polymorpha]BBN17495.1 hypothetical protein Mp_7g15010 [Marchantia polymorpha subsp. ruderalis]|eukprot:PTQ47101.1 hypothetical protein MARPO_0009s0185 [Marchantia polymorpha]